MEKNMSRIKYYIYVATFIVLNIGATYFITTKKFNKYINPSVYTFGGVVNSIIGNFVVLLLVTFIITTLVKKPKNRMLTLLITTFFLNGALFALNSYNRFYHNAFTFKSLSMLKNPSEGFGFTIVWEALKEMITYYRIILFIPFIVLLILYYTLMNKEEKKELTLPKMSFKLGISRFIVVALLFFVNISFFTSRSANIVIINSEKPMYSTQNLGLYNFLLMDAFGYEYNNDLIDKETLTKELDAYNKNKDSYINALDNKEYSKSPKLQDTTNLSGPLINNLNNNDNLTGLLKDYNLVLVHLESFNKFLLEQPEVVQNYFYVTSILEQSYVFDNFYTSVGLGNSFDAEISVLTGLMPNGTSTLAWDFDAAVESKNFDFQTLPKLFKDKDYLTNSYHGNNETFYNRNNAHPGMFGFDELKAKDKILQDLDLTLVELQEAYSHDSKFWISDRAVIKYLNDDINENYSVNQKFMKFLITIMPHTPFYYDPYFKDPKEANLYSPELISGVDIVTLRYLNYAKYYNELFRVMFEDVNGYGDDYVYSEANLYNRKKTAYVFYGDHGSGINHNDLNNMFDKELEQDDITRKLLQTTAFIYVPGDNIVSKTLPDNSKVNIREGLLKGKQSLVRGQVDLYRTIVDLFDLPIQSEDYIYGVHGMSKEPTYVLDNKSLNIMTDKYFDSLSNSKYDHYLPHEKAELLKLKKMIREFKNLSDEAINSNSYKEFKKKK